MTVQQIVDWPPLEQMFRRYTVTPDMARTWLQSNTHNRRLASNVVDRYAASMRLAQWRCTMDNPIVFDANGALQDGQHRLHAVIKADVDVDFWVGFGADPGDFHVIGAGRRRSVADVLALEGRVNATTRAAAARQVLGWRAAPHRVWTGTTLTQVGVTDQSIINEALREEYDKCNGYIHTVRSASVVTPTTMLAHAVLVLDQSSYTDDLDEFVSRLASGAGMDLGNPILTLRNWYMSQSALRGMSGGTWAQQRKLSIHIRAWNAWVGGESLRLLKFNQQNLPMPEVK